MRVTPPPPKRNTQHRVLIGVGVVIAAVIVLLVWRGVRPLDAAVWVMGWLVIASAVATGVFAGVWLYSHLFGKGGGS